MRLHRKAVENIYSGNEKFTLGKGKVLRDGADVTIIATGAIMVPEALRAAELLAGDNISAAVIDMHTIKPLDEELVLEYAGKTRAVVTCENHNIINGLGSAVAEFLSETYPIYVKRVGVNDLFGEVGKLGDLQDRFGLRAENIVVAAKETINKK